MKVITLIGLVFLLAGGFVVVRGLTYTSDKSVLKVGGLEASVEERHAVPTWLGGVAALLGIAMIAAGARGKV